MGELRSLYRFGVKFYSNPKNENSNKGLRDSF